MSALAYISNASKSARGNNNGVDRLSSLPDELLRHVMSFLPMPEVVRTSVLSPRWRNVWASTPFIHIDRQDFKDENKPSCVDADKLEKFGDKLLLLRDGSVCLDEARIFVSDGDAWKSYVWIRHAIKHKVRLLHISGLKHCPSTSMFPSQHLKQIILKSVLLFHKFFRPLNDDCPVLEHLELEECNLFDVKEISSRSLKVQHMIGVFNLAGLLICARNLMHLSIINPVCRGAIVTRDLSSLVTASVIISSEEFHIDKDAIRDGHRILDGLSHATNLELHAPLDELAFERGLQTFPMFGNLTSLVLGDWCMGADLYPLLCILQCSSKLKELSVKLEMEECHFCMASESSLLSSRDTLSATESYPSIQRIKICCCKDDPRVGGLVQALLPIINPDEKISIERC